MSLSPSKQNSTKQQNSQDVWLRPGVQQHPHDRGHLGVQRVSLEGQRANAWLE